MDKDYGAVATEVLKLLKEEYNKAKKRLYCCTNSYRPNGLVRQQ